MSDPIDALLASAARVRNGDWVRGAPSHVLAELLTDLEAHGWRLTKAVERSDVSVQKHRTWTLECENYVWHAAPGEKVRVVKNCGPSKVYEASTVDEEYDRMLDLLERRYCADTYSERTAVDGEIATLLREYGQMASKRRRDTELREGRERSRQDQRGLGGE